MPDIREYWRLALAKRGEEMRPFFRQDAVIRWHNTNEEFDVDEFLQVWCKDPQKLQGEYLRAEKTGYGMLTVLRVFPKKNPADFRHVSAFFSFRKGKISAIDEFWSEVTEAPDWRREQGLGHPIVAPEEPPETEPPAFAIRRGEAGDFPAVQALVKLELDLHYENRPDYFQWAVYGKKEYEELTARASAIAWVAELEGKTVGVCLGRIGKTPGNDLKKERKIAIIQDLVVLPEHRKKGIAKALMEKAREQAEAAGAAAMELAVWDFNQEALGLYRKLGMKPQYHRLELPLGGGRLPSDDGQ